MIKNRILTLLVSLLLLVLNTSVADAQRNNEVYATNAVLAGVQAFDEGNYELAIEVFEKAISASADNDAAWYYIGLCSVGLGDVSKAEACLEEAVRLDPSNFWYRYKLAGFYGLTGREELAVDMYEKLLKDFPDKNDLYIELVEMYSAQKEYDKALETIDDVITIFGVTEAAIVYKYNLLQATGAHKEAYRVLEDYNSRYSSPYVLSVLAEYYWGQNDDSMALAYCDEALELDPGYYYALLCKAEILRLTFRYEEYFEVLKQFVSTETVLPKYKLEYLSNLLGADTVPFPSSYFTSMDTVVENLVEVHPDDSLSLGFAGAYYSVTDRIPQAEIYIRRNVQNNPDAFSAVTTYLDLLITTREWEELASATENAIEKFGERPELLHCVIVSYVNLEKYTEAVDMCDRLMLASQDDPAMFLETLIRKGDVYALHGGMKKAYKVYEQVLKIDPENVYVLNNYAYFLCLDGKCLKKAYKMSKATLDVFPDDATYLDTFGWILYTMGKPEEAKTHFKRAMFYGGKDSAVVLDHYAEVLFALGEYDKAMVYWNQALRKNNGDVEDLEDRISLRKQQMKNKEK